MESIYDTIPVNDYKPVTKVREDVVIGICHVFLNGDYGSTFYPRGNGWQGDTDYIAYNKESNRFVSFASYRDVFEKEHHNCYKSTEFIKIHKCEVLKAVEILRSHGFFIYRYNHDYSPLTGYGCGKYPTISYGVAVDTIDIPDNF